LTDKALTFALRLSKDVNAVHLTELRGPGDDDEAALPKKWAQQVEAPARAAGLNPPRLLVIRSEYRLMHEPLLKLIKEIETQHPARTIAVLLPEVVKTIWWQYLLHEHRARRLRSKLLRYGGSQVVVVDIPGYFEEPKIEEGIIVERGVTEQDEAEAAAEL